MNPPPQLVLPWDFSPQRILVRGTNWLGDAVMTTPALIRLRERFPGAHITVFGPEKLRDLWLPTPKPPELGAAQTIVDDTLSFSPRENVFAVAKKLRAGQFDLALVLPNSPRSALEVFLAGIPQRVGYRRPWRNLFLTRTVPARIGAVKMQKRSIGEIHDLTADLESTNAPPAPAPIPPAAHHIFEYLHLVAALGGKLDPVAPKLMVTADEITAARRQFGLPDSPNPVFGLNPGAEYGPAKRWPVEKFIAAARQIREQTHCTWLILGGKGDLDLAQEIEQGLQNSDQPPLNLAGKTSLRQLMAVLKNCRVLLTNDTGPMHVAAALGIPVVVPFGSTSPALTGPGFPGDSRHHLIQSDAPCSPCFLRQCPIDFRCLNQLRADRVAAAVLQAASRS